jgi:putative iron-dependent peroxidase
MLENMFVGRPPGNYDRLLDFSRPVTGTLFFVPPATFLDDVEPVAATASADAPAMEPAHETPSESQAAAGDGSLGVGSLKRETGQE